MADPTPLEPTQQGRVEVGPHAFHFERFGRGERDTVCLLNGLAMHTRSWYPVLPRLLDDWDVLLYDYPGQGESSWDDRPVEIPELAAALPAVLDATGVERCHLLGISYGGFVALDAARLFHQRLHTLTLSGILLSHEQLFQMYEALSLRFYAGTEAEFELYTRYMYEKIFGEAFVRTVGPALETMRQRFFERYRDRKRALVRLTEAQDPFFDRLDANLPGYRAVPTPTLIVAGAQDRVLPPWVQRKIAGVLPRVRYEELADSGHVVYLEQPERFFATIGAFFRRRDLDF